MTDFSKLARRITIILFVTQSLYSAGNIASATVNPIVGAQLGGSDYWTGVPTAVFLLGAAFSSIGNLRLGMVAVTLMLISSYVGIQKKAVGGSREYGGVLSKV